MNDRSALCLFSPGIDSPVAADLLMHQGLRMELIHFDNFSGRNKLSLDTVEKIRKVIEKRNKTELKITIIDYSSVQKEFMAKCNRRYQCLLCKAGMYMISEYLAGSRGIDFLATGENLGQVASQTLENMATLDSFTDMVVLRPLLCYDKDDIIKRARKIGSFGISIKGNPKCSFVPDNPKTRSKREAVMHELGKIGGKEGLIRIALDGKL